MFYEETINEEIKRQRDKTDNNSIGYFHQNIFKYFENCIVPEQGWDVIYTGKEKTYYVEMKNKHNTMNDASSNNTILKMYDKVNSDPNAICCLVEVIAKSSGNKVWKRNGKRNDRVFKIENERIRRVSIDQFYSIVTGEEDAFYQVCQQLPITINKLVKNKNIKLPEDTVIDELEKIDDDKTKALFSLAFGSYLGFKKKGK